MPKGILRKWLFDKSIPISKTTAWRLKGKPKKINKRRVTGNTRFTDSDIKFKCKLFK